MLKHYFVFFLLNAGIFLIWLFPVREKIAARKIKKQSSVIRELEEARKRLHDTLESITDGFFSLDRDWRFTYLNEQGARFLQSTREELLGKSWWDAVPADCPFEPILNKCMEEKVPLRDEGRCPISDTWFSCRVYPSAEGISVYLEDISARKRAEEALTKSKEMLHAALDNIPDVFVIYDPDRKIRFINQAAVKLTGRQISDFLGKKDEEAWPDSVTSRYLPQLRRAVQTRRPQHFEMTQHIPGGKLYTSMVTYVPLLDERGEVYQVLGITNDITARKCAEEELKKAHGNLHASLKEKETLLRELYHRTKNNMQVISSLLNLQAASVKDDSVKQIFRETRNRIQGMSLIHEKLYKSRDLYRVDLGEYIKELVEGILGTYGPKGDKIALQTDLEPVPVSIDTAIPCGLIINELISNSFKHAFPGERQGAIRVSLHGNGNDDIELGYADNGVGLPKDLDMDKTASLGLKLIYSLASKQLGGTVRLLSEKGTEFRIKFRATHPV